MRENDAEGLLVIPGCVDIHTDYDDQVTWAAYITPSIWHGVTTVVMGNCGVGFALAEANQQDWLISPMEGAEYIPSTALAEGIKWEWESFPQHLDSIDKPPRAIDVIAQVPHGALRDKVMGKRGADHAARHTPEEIETRCRLAREAVAADFVGFSRSRTKNPRTKDGKFIGLAVRGRPCLRRPRIPMTGYWLSDSAFTAASAARAW